MATEAARLECAGIHRKERETERKNILTRKKKKNILDTHRPSHGRS
jgi:predicted Ser/Thr protein kinase